MPDEEISVVYGARAWVTPVQRSARMGVAGVFGRSWRVGSLANVDIRIDASWPIVVVLITASLYSHFSDWYPVGRGQAIALASAAAAMFFSSVLLHELAHAVVAQRRGMRVDSITLFLFGGATNARADSRRPGDEFLVAGAGPATSVMLAVAFWLVVLGGDALPDPIVGLAAYLGVVNAVLAVFNLLPGFPLDGGRMLRAGVWKATGSVVEATGVASAVGRALGGALIAAGIVLVVMTEAVIAGIWFAGIGWFLMRAAKTSYEDVRRRARLADVSAADVVLPAVVPIEPEATLREAADGIARSGVLSVQSQGRPIGVLTADGLRSMPPAVWDQRRVKDAMIVLNGQPAVDPSVSMTEVVVHLEDAPEVVVVRDGRPIGIITIDDVSRWFASGGGRRIA